MLTTRILVPVFGFLVAIGIVAVATLPPYIPSWSGFQAATATLGILGGIAVAVMLCRGIYLHTREKLQVGFRVVLVVAVSVLAGAVLFVASMVTVFSLGGHLFAPTYDHEADFPAYNTTFYVYDNGFLDASTLVTCRQGWLPFTYEIGSFPNSYANDVQFSQEGEWAVCALFKMHLPTGEVSMNN